MVTGSASPDNPASSTHGHPTHNHSPLQSICHTVDAGPVFQNPRLWRITIRRIRDSPPRAPIVVTPQISS
jgi:hypothetical protein